jgi:aspartyl-tRNA(Asn)/glutamyl-tRNA(Gln) amidotransferase subunit C
MITPEDVKKIASLSRIYLRHDELEHLAKDLENINQLEKLDVTSIEPTSHVLPLKNVYRDDIVETPLTCEQALKNAPAQDRKHFKVPKVIE